MVRGSDYFGCNGVFSTLECNEIFYYIGHYTSFLVITILVKKKEDKINKKKRCNEMNSSNNDKTQPTLEVFGESEDRIGKYGHKGIFHRHRSNLNIPAIMEDVS